MTSNKMSLTELLKHIDLDHFYNGWNMWPAWWNESTPSWQLGYKLRANQEKTGKERTAESVEKLLKKNK